MNKEYAILVESHRKLRNNFIFQSELNRILKTQIEPSIYSCAEKQAKILCYKRFRKKSLEIINIINGV